MALARPIRLAMTLTSLLVATPALSAGQSREQAKLTIGTILPMTGPQAAFGREALRGIEIALDLLRQSDPALAEKVSLVKGDDASSRPGAEAEVARLIDKEHVHILIGSFAADTTTAAATAAQAKGIPFLTPLAAAQTPKPGGVYRISFDEAAAGATLAQYALTTLNLRTAGTLRDTTAGATAFEAGFADAFTAGGGQIAARAAYDLGQDNFASALEEMQKLDVGFIATPAPWPTAAQMLRQARHRKFRAPFGGGETWDTDAFNQAAGADIAAGQHFIGHFSPADPDPVTKEFVKAFKTRHGRAPGSVAALAHDAARVAIEAVKRANSNVSSALRQELGRLQDYNGATGLLTLGPDGTVSKAGILKKTTPKGSVFVTRLTAVRPPVKTAAGTTP